MNKDILIVTLWKTGDEPDTSFDKRVQDNIVHIAWRYNIRISEIKVFPCHSGGSSFGYSIQCIV